MLGLRFPRPKGSPLELLRSTLFSCSLVLFSQFALALVPWLFPSISFLAMLPIAALIIAVTILLGRFLRRRFGVSASAPALVVFNILFMWGVYVTIIRKVIPSLLDAVLNAVCALLLYGLYRIFSGDPGTVAYNSSNLESGQNEFDTLKVQCESSPTLLRVKYCKSCKTSIKGFDHHCPAFGNFIDLTKSADAQRIEVLFLIWHIYCICFNIKSEEWINWKRCPEFQHMLEPQPGSPFRETRFAIPYDKGLLGNIQDFINSKAQNI